MTDTNRPRRSYSSRQPAPSRRLRPRQRSGRPSDASVIGSDWRRRLPSALFRVTVAIGFLATPTFEARFGSFGMPLVVAGLAVTALMLAHILRLAIREYDWTLPAVDTVCLLVFVPVAKMASGIEVADVRLGGGAEHFAAAAAAVVGVTAIVALVSALLNGRDLELGVLGLLPAPLAVAAVIAGASRFSAGSIEQGLSIAWLFAAVITMLHSVTAGQVRSLLAPVGFAVFAVGIAIVARGQTSAAITATNSALALTATALAGATLLLLPLIMIAANGDHDRGGSSEGRNHPR